MKTLRKAGKSRKSQVWYLDFMVGISIFITIIVMYYHYYGNATDDSESEWQEIIIDSKAISSSLISQGYPKNWTNSTVSVMGITDGNYRINSTKLQMLQNMSYKQAKETLKTKFDFYFFLQDANGNAIASAGINATNPKLLVQATRFAIYNSNVTKMVVHVWKS